jgi:tRNA pseudouridine13 synthase
VSGDRARAEATLATIRQSGVPNYFGEQRFGRGNHNLALADALFAGRRLQRAERGFALSAARSALFNAVLAARVEAGNWNRALDGDVWMLDGTHSLFGPQAWDDTLTSRLAELDIHPTGPLWGRGELRSEAQARAIELAVVEAQRMRSDGLERAGLDQERRTLRLRASDLACEWADDDLLLSFRLDAGAYATTVLREVCDWSDSPGVDDE